MKVIKIRSAHIIPFLLIILLFIPMIVIKFSFIDSTVSLSTNLLVLSSLLLWMRNKCHMSKWLKAVGIFCVLIIAITVLNQGNLMNAVISYTKLFAFCMIVEKLIIKYRQDMFQIIKNALFLLVALNMISMILMPNGIIQLERTVNEWYQYAVPWWFFGNKNSMYLWLFPTNLLAQISILKNRSDSKSNVYNYIILFTTVISAFLSLSSTTIFTICLNTLFICFTSFFTRLSHIFNMKNYIIFFVVLTILLVTSSQLSLFVILTQLFEKDITFTGRATAWQQSLTLFMNKPVIGYGVLSENDFRALLGAHAFVNTHNSLLQILVEGGILLLAQFFVLLKILSKKLKEMKLENKMFYSLSTWCILSLFIQMSFEATIGSKMFWMILTIMYYIPLLIKNDVKAEENRKRSR